MDPTNRNKPPKVNNPEIHNLQHDIMSLEIKEHEDEEYTEKVPDEIISFNHPTGFPQATHRNNNESSSVSLKSTKREMKIYIIPESQIKTPLNKDQSKAVIEVLDEANVAKLQWTNPILNEEEENANKSLPKSINNWQIDMLRFDHEGRICTKLVRPQKDDDSSDYEDHMYYYKGLHHHGDQAHLPGYTLPELFHLSQSSFGSQRLLALRIIAEILAHARQGVPFFIPTSSKSTNSAAPEEDINPLASTAFGFGINRFMNYIICDLNIANLIIANLSDSSPVVQTATLHIFSNLVFLPISCYNIDKIGEPMPSPFHNTKPQVSYIPQATSDSHQSCVDLFNMILEDNNATPSIKRTWDSSRKFDHLIKDEPAVQYFCYAAINNLGLTFLTEYSLETSLKCLNEFPKNQITPIYSCEAMIAHNILNSNSKDKFHPQNDILNKFHLNQIIPTDAQASTPMKMEEFISYLVISHGIILQVIENLKQHDESSKAKIYFLRLLNGLALHSSPLALYLSRLVTLNSYLKSIAPIDEYDDFSLCLCFHMLAYFYSIRSVLLESVPKSWKELENSVAKPLVMKSIMLTLNSSPEENISQVDNYIHMSWSSNCSVQALKFTRLDSFMGLFSDLFTSLLPLIEVYSAKLKNALTTIGESESDKSEKLFTMLINNDGAVYNQILLYACSELSSLSSDPMQISMMLKHASFFCEYFALYTQEKESPLTASIVSQLYISSIRFLTKSNYSLYKLMLSIKDNSTNNPGIIFNPLISICNELSDTLSRWSWNTQNNIRAIEMYGSLLSSTVKNIFKYIRNCDIKYVVHYCTEMGWTLGTSHTPLFYNDPSFHSESAPFKRMVLHCGVGTQILDYFSSLLKMSNLLEHLAPKIDFNNIKDQCVKLLDTLNNYCSCLFLEIRAATKRRARSKDNQPALPAVPAFEIFAKLILSCCNFLQLLEKPQEFNSELIPTSCISALACTCTTSTVFKIFQLLYTNLHLPPRYSNWKKKDNWNHLTSLITSIALGNPLSLTFLNHPQSHDSINLTLSINALDAWLIVLPQHTYFWASSINKEMWPLMKNKKTIYNVLSNVFCMSIDILISDTILKYLRDLYPKRLILQSLSSIFSSQGPQEALKHNINNLHHDSTVQKQLKRFIKHYFHDRIIESLRRAPFINTTYSKKYLDLFYDVISIWSIISNFHMFGSYKLDSLVAVSKELIDYQCHFQSITFPAHTPRMQIFGESYDTEEEIMNSNYFKNCMKLKSKIDSGSIEDINSSSLLLFYTSSIFPDVFRRSIWDESLTMRTLSKAVRVRDHSGFLKDNKLIHFNGLIGPIQVYISNPTDDHELLHRYKRFIKKFTSDKEFENGCLAIFIALHQIICYLFKIGTSLTEYIGSCKSEKLQHLITAIDLIFTFENIKENQ